ncbi:hypothetical protein SFB3_108G6 [Candidatus Arthromitus sp. SFB-3]|nr:hypothetical protein SFB3_108G6 [Candidatus Arthromitus sp. SFB-3]
MKSKKYKETLILKLEECKKYNQIIKCISEKFIEINLEDGISNIYEKLQKEGDFYNQNIFK